MENIKQIELYQLDELNDNIIYGKEYNNWNILKNMIKLIMSNDIINTWPVGEVA